MTKSILIAHGAFILALCAIVLITVFSAVSVALTAIGAVLLIFAAICLISYGIEDTELADKMANIFREEASHE